VNAVEARGVVMVGITGTALDPQLPRFGGYLLFPGDDAPLQRVRALTDSLRSRHDDGQPLIAIDQEGGAVERLRNGVEPMPPMMALGAADDIELTRRAGEQTAFDLRRAGCTLDFAPVLDLALDPANVVIGTRSFGSNPQRVAALGAVFADGLRSGGILPCYKHFPGHGSTAVDSHLALPIVETDEATLRARDLAPFAAVARDAPAFMSAHVVIRVFDPKRPATLSPRIARDLLRDELRFGGALITDCLEMKAVGERDSVESAVEALVAGADLVLFSHDLDLANAACAAIEARVPRQRLDEAYARVLRLRQSGAAPLPLDTFAPHPGIGREIARRAVTLLRGVPHADPLASVAVSFGPPSKLEHEAPALEAISVSLDPQAHEIRTLLEVLDVRQRRPLLLSRRAHLHPAQAQAVAQIVERYPDALVASLLEPFDVPLFGNARHLLAAYGDDQASIGGLADVLFGGSMPTGNLPVEGRRT